ncbi:MAG: hypothetical protein WBP29_08700 [Candidatus Zixiibacteriota bacterium]
MRRCLYYIVPAVAVLVALSCGKSSPSARQKVLDFVRTIQADSLADITPFIDLDSVATYEYKDSEYDSLSLDLKKRRLLAGFVGSGEYRGVWAKSQIVVNNEFYSNDTTAKVEVSFIDRSTRIQYYSQMGLKLRSNQWVITNFKVNQDSN